MADDENQPLMSDKSSDDKSDQTKNETKFLCCFPMVCGMISAGIWLIVALAFGFWQASTIDSNEYFDEYYFYWYIAFYIPLIIAAVSFLVYWVSWKDDVQKMWLPGSLLLAWVFSGCLFWWIAIYLYSHLRPDQNTMWVGSGPKAANDEDEMAGTHYRLELKYWYFLKHSLFWVFSFIIFLTTFCYSLVFIQQPSQRKKD